MRRLASILFTISLAISGVAQADQDTIARILAVGKNSNQVWDHLTHLSLKIGHRLTASTNLDKAYDWTQKKFKEFGCTNVHLEKWGEWPVRFDRGSRQIGRMVSPEKLAFEFSSPSWTPGTNGSVKGIAVLEPTTIDELNAAKEKLKGAWLISKTAPPRRGAELTVVQKGIAESGIAGTVYSSRNELVITSGNYNISWDNLPKDVRITVRKSNMDKILGLMAENKQVVLEFDMRNKFSKGPIPNYNVVAEIKGTEKPEEVVIVSGHLDTWDGPGSQGACDNGTGISVTLEAARILLASKAKPKRTIRFILWTGEEQGLFGSRAYVEAHKTELGNISAVFVDDGGTNYQGGLTCIAEMMPILEAAIEPAHRAFIGLPMQIRVVDRMPRGGGSDHAPFNAVGVPGFFWMETGRADYTFVHHTQNDRLEHAIPEYLVQSSTNTALVSYAVACAPTMLPREKPITPLPISKLKLIAVW